MIFYTILSQYPDIDRANVVLTAMIVYIIIYIALPDKWNGLALGALASLDYIALKLPPFDTFNVYMLKLARSLKKRFKRFTDKIGGGPDKDKKKDKKGKKRKDKKRKDKNKGKKDKKKDKRVRFAKHNSYHEFDTFKTIKPQTPVQGGGQMNIPDWMLTPQQRIQRAQQNVLKQQQKALSTPGFMIDNRHLALSEDEDSSDESIASDESSELTNSEEGLDF